MMQFRSILLLSLLALAAGANLRNATAAKKPNATAAKPPAAKDQKAEVDGLRAKLEKISVGLNVMLSPEGSLAQSKIANELQSFVGQIKVVLNETKGSYDAKSVKKLKDAQSGVQSLIRDMTIQQTRLMTAGDEQEQSLLLGILMTSKNKPMHEQLEVLGNDEFSHLKVVKAILAQKDMKTPLYIQAAEFLDKQHASPVNKTAAKSTVGTAAAIPEKLKVGKDGKPDVSPIISALEFRLHNLEDSEKHRASLHQEAMSEFDKAIKKEEAKKNQKAAKHVDRMKKSENRKYMKQEAVTKNDIKSLTSAIEAIKTGDMKTLAKSQAALEASMKAMQAEAGGFLYLIQLGHRSMGRDCPYCAAQCVDKCHTAGKPYVQCLTDCADAGK